MKITLLLAATLIFCSANAAGQGKTLTTDPLTKLPLISATDSGKHFGNEPTSMPDSRVCKSAMQGNFYLLYNIKVDAAAAWYASHLASFQKANGYGSRRAQIAFYNSDRSILVIVTGDPGGEGQNTDAYSVAYERYQPGLSEKTITGLTHGKMVCQ